MSGIDDILAGYESLRAGQEAFYLDLHQHPELSHAEHRTARRVAEQLRHSGFTIASGIGGTGVAGVLANGSGPAVLLRCELDALPLREATGGTATMDTVRYMGYRRAGGTQSPLAWEFGPVETWQTGPDPGQVAKRMIEGFTQRKLPDRWARLTSTAAHWAYGSAAAAAYGILAGSPRRPHAAYGLPFGAVVWAAGYVVLPEAGLYKPIYEYDAKNLASDLSAHLAYGADTRAAFWLSVKALP